MMHFTIEDRKTWKSDFPPDGKNVHAAKSRVSKAKQSNLIYFLFDLLFSCHASGFTTFAFLTLFHPMPQQKTSVAAAAPVAR